jgi:putative tricarboxylic transport membrane protein
MWKGLLSIAIGLLLGAVGLDVLSATPRLGIIPKLGMLEGIDLIPFLMGAFAISEVMVNILPGKRRESEELLKLVTGFHGPSLTFRELKNSLKALITGSFIGSFIGAVPGLGATAAAFLSYGISKQTYKGKGKDGVKFGEGAIEGVFAAESANSAVSGSSFIPLLALGIPGSATSALMLAAFMLHGISPGPGIFNNHAVMVYAFFLALMVGSMLNVLYANLMTKPLTWLLKKNPNIVYPIVLLLCFAGAYTINNRVFDLGIMVAIGGLAFLMKRVELPVAPMVIGFILSKILEQNFRMSLAITSGNYNIFWSSPINKVMMALSVLALIAVTYQRLKGGSDLL